MKIILTIKETKAMKEFYDEVLETVPNLLKVDFDKAMMDIEKSTSAVSVSLNSKLGMTVDIKESAVIEFMTVYSDFIGLAIPQSFALFQTIKKFTKKIDKIGESYSINEEKEN